MFYSLINYFFPEEPEKTVTIESDSSEFQEAIRIHKAVKKQAEIHMKNREIARKEESQYNLQNYKITPEEYETILRNREIICQSKTFSTSEESKNAQKSTKKNEMFENNYSYLFQAPVPIDGENDFTKEKISKKCTNANVVYDPLSMSDVPNVSRFYGKVNHHLNLNDTRVQEEFSWKSEDQSQIKITKHNTLGDGNCLLHAWLMSTREEYRAADEISRRDMAKRLRNKMPEIIEETFHVIRDFILKNLNDEEYISSLKEHLVILAKDKWFSEMEVWYIPMLSSYYKIDVILLENDGKCFNCRYKDHGIKFENEYSIIMTFSSGHFSACSFNDGQMLLTKHQRNMVLNDKMLNQ